MSGDAAGAAACSEVMVENRETWGAAGLPDLRELRATREGLETAGRRACRAREDLGVSRLKAEQEADMIE